MNRARTILIAAVVSSSLVSSALADGFLVIKKHPRIGGVYSVPYHHVDMKVDDQICRVQITQSFLNPTGRTLEAEYLFPLPEDAAIDNFVMLVDGKELPGKIMGREEARRIYEGIVRQKKDPALLEFMGRGLFKTSVFPIPPGKERQVNISYSQLCKRDGNVIEIGYPLGTEKYSARPLNELKINCHISSKHPIKSVYSSTHDVNITRPGEKAAEVSLLQHQVIPRNDLSLFYTISDSEVGLSVLSYRPNTSEPGYFLLLTSPKIESSSSKVLAKSVIFVLDKSGSMMGKKIEQARNSLRFVLKNLNPGDTFNIVTYDSAVSSFAPELQRVDSEVIEKALGYVSQISAGGSTNIDGALRTAMGMLKAPEAPSYIIFLTDGLPTAGEQKETAIVNNCTRANSVRARLMAFGVGDDVNARLLDKLTAGNFGDSNYVRPNQDIEAPVSSLFSKLSSPVLSRLKLDLPGMDNSLTNPKTLPDLFRGSQLVLVGRYHQSGSVSVKLSGQVSDQEQVFTEQVNLDGHQALYSRSFVEKLWAERRIGYLIDELDLRGHNQELVNEIVMLSTRHGILTPYTSFLAEEGVQLADVRRNVQRAGENLKDLEKSFSGGHGVRQRVNKGKKMKQKRPSSSGFISYDSMEADDESIEVRTVLNIGLKTFFKKKGQWLDSTVTEEQRKKAIKLMQYSDEYFDVVRTLPATMNQYFAIEGELVLNIKGQTYQVVPQNGAP